MHIESIMESYFYLFTCLHFGSILPIPQQDRELRRFWFRNFRLTFGAWVLDDAQIQQFSFTIGVFNTLFKRM